MAKLEPYLHFDGNAREGMAFYKGVFGGDLDISTVGESPMAEQMPDAKDRVMHSTLRSGETTLMASDMFDKEGGHPESAWGNMVSLSLQCSSEDEIKTLFDKLAEGGTVDQPLQDTFWGATFGVTFDKFGVRWMLNFDKPKAT